MAERTPTDDDWTVLASPHAGVRVGRIPTSRAVVGRLVAAAAVVSLIIGTMAFYVSNKLAEQDTLSEGIRITDILAGEITGELSEKLFAGDTGAVAELDRGVLPAMNNYGVRRVKVFDASGLVLYSDEHRLIGKTFSLGELEHAAFGTTRPLAEVSSPNGAENEYEKVSGLLIEVRRSMAGWAGRPALLEVYLDYNIVGERASQMWRAFLALLVGSLALLTVMVIPVAFQLLRRIDEGTRQRESLLRRAVEASDLERRRIAGSLHDGPVQELVGNTLSLSSSAERLAADGQTDAAASVSRAAGAVRQTVGSLRSLLVDLYPASLDDVGLAPALDDLLAPLRSRGVRTVVSVADDDLDPLDRRLAYRVAQECLRNAGKHAGATAVSVRLGSDAVGWGLSIMDNGQGFDVEETFAKPDPGHFGLRILADLDDEAGAELKVASGPDGTRWELRKDRS